MFPSISLTASNLLGMEYVLAGGDARSVWTSIFGTDGMSVEIAINSCDAGSVRVFTIPFCIVREVI
jgi:hypothetical protein